MSELRSALDGLLFVDDGALSDDQLVADLDEVERGARQLEVVRARRLAELERRQVWSRDGHLSLASWLASRHRVSHTVAASHLRTARALEQMPVMAQALAAGDVSSSAVTLLAHARDTAPEQFARAEETLVDAARTLPVDQLQATVMRWREHANAERAAEDDEARQERRAVSTVVTFEGMVESTVKLAPSDGQVYLTAIRTAEDAEVRSLNGVDRRTPAQRRADALVQVCRHYLDAQNRPVVAGERPHVIVTIDVESLDRSENAPGTARSAGARLSDVGAISAADALMWACDAQVTRVITDAASRPLDVGRATRITPPWIRKALLVRDGGCAFPDCGRPPSWCDPHHVVHWTNGGPTALSNLVLLCRRHHRLVHHRKFGVEIADGLPRFHRADGSVLTAGSRAPP
jgi:Domain of unknown function (DUF222)/HNH endonuclease